MRRTPTFWLFFVVALVVAAVAARHGTARRQEDRAPALPGKGLPPGVQGVATCASMACHHANGPKGSKGSEYSTWIAHDPHARAYRVLFEKRSRDVAKALARKDDKGKLLPAHRDPLCLSCHVHPDPDVRGTPERQRFAWSDGVGCEPCHGEAKNWLTTHYLAEFLEQTPAKKAEVGLKNTKSLRVRAEVCARCHVGDREMDVNHDLIAAGHPRLRFEFAAYHANYPKHWREKAPRKDFEARAWAIGQLVSAQAALELLQHRATASSTNAEKPWPEFAEYNCAACHHDLKGGPKPNLGPRLAGDLLWGTWYFAMLPALAEAPGGPRSKLDLGPLDKMMRKRVPNEKKVSEEARARSRELGAWLDALERAPAQDAAQLARLVRELAGDRAGLAPTTWDGSTQLYLGLAAAYHGWGDALSPDKPPAGAKKALEALRDELEKAFPRGGTNVYDSPSNFRPSRLQAPLGELRKRAK